MANEEMNRLLAKIGQLLAEDRSYPLDETLLYARVEEGMAAPSIFKNLGNQILYREPDLSPLCDALFDLWYAEDPDKRWAELEYVVRDATFTATYGYDKIDPEEDTFERRDRVVRRHFGDKPIVYPPWEDDDDGHQYDL